MAKINSLGTIVAVSGMSATLSLRVNLAVQHMLAAARFSREVGDVERANKNSEFGDFWTSILHNSVACVLTAVASLEAYANELFSDRTKVFVGFTDELLHNLWTTYEAKPLLEKYQFALILLNKPKMNSGASPFQDVRLLVELRNALTHFKPEWDTEADYHKKLSLKLKPKFQASDFLSDQLLFPRRWASHSCTRWAVTSALSFAEEFERIATLPKKYADNSGGLTA